MVLLIINILISLYLLLPLKILAYENVIENGDFESGEKYWSLDYINKGGKFYIDDINPLNGGKSLCIEGEKESVFLLLTQYNINLNSGKEYILRFSYKWNNPVEGAYLLDARVGLKNLSGKLDISNYIYFDELSGTKLNEKDVYKRRFFVPDGYKGDFIQFIFFGRWGTFRIDDVKITLSRPEDKDIPLIKNYKIKKPSLLKSSLYSMEKNFISNPGFEDGWKEWDVPIPGEGVITSLEEYEPLVGKMSLKMEGKRIAQTQILNKSIALPSGKEYILRFLYRWEREKDVHYTALPRIGIRDPAGKWKYILFKDFHDLTPTEEKVKIYEKRFIVPEGFEGQFFQFFMVGYWGTIWIDDVLITDAKKEENFLKDIIIPTDNPF